MHSTFAKLCPFGHYARKNIGYLAAVAGGAEIIVETDDDNLPMSGFWNERARHVQLPLLSRKGWSNVYKYFSEANIWPRGLPLNRILDVPEPAPATTSHIDCPIQQGLADNNPDVDAIYRLVLPLPVTFKPNLAFALNNGVWCPFNSQNTTFWRDAFPLLYLPFHCSFRMTDIWRSFIAQRLLWENNWRLMFHSPTVIQERNEHDLLIDFQDEIPGYLGNEKIRRVLEDIDVNSGTAALPDNLRRCYARLVALGVISKEEEPLLDAWLTDLVG